jgi:hypothetical protein
MAENQPSDEKPIARARLETSDEEILDRFETRARMTWRMLWVLPSGIALVVGATAAAIFSGHAALVAGMWGRIVIAAVIGALFVYAFVTIIKSSIQPIKADSPRLVQRRLDHYQGVRRWSILIGVFMMFFVLMGIPHAVPVLRAARQLPLLIGAGALIAGIMLMNALLLSSGPRWQTLVPPGVRELPNDEFDRALRARTTRFGYILVMLLLAGALPVALWRPDWALTAIACALYAGFAAPALYYIIGDWRASRGGEG